MRYLSDEWLAEVGAAAAAVTVEHRPDQPTLVVQTVVTDGPTGDVTFHLVLDHGRLAVEPGVVDDPTVTFTQTFQTATDVASGRRSAQAAFMAGEVRVGGDVTVLIEHRDVLSAFDGVMESVAAITEYATTGN